MSAYKALRDDLNLDSPPKYGINFANVYKRYNTRLICKRYYHHHWGTKAVAVMQDIVYY